MTEAVVRDLKWVSAALAVVAVVALVLVLRSDDEAPRPIAPPARASLDQQERFYRDQGLFGLVLRSEYERLPSDAPERVLLEWWRALQSRDVDTAYDLLTADLREALDRDEFAQRVDLAAGGFTGHPDVIGEREDAARQEVALDVFVTLYAGRDTPGQVLSRVFRLREDQGRWRISDLSHFETSLRAGLAAARERRLQAAAGRR